MPDMHDAPATRCKYCNRELPVPCLNTRDMEEIAIFGDRECFWQLALLGGGERGLQAVISLHKRKNTTL